MSSGLLETEEQCRRRVSSRIRNEVQAQTGQDLLEMSRVGKLPDQWMASPDLNRLLDESGYWLAHPHIMAQFLPPDTCERILERSLEELTAMHPDAWIGSEGRYKPALRDLNAYAARKANELRFEMPDATRTVLHGGASGESILFAHENHNDEPRAREQVTLLRGFLFEAGIPELGFGVSDDGQTWVMVVWSQDEAALNRALMQAWQNAYASDDLAAAA